MGREHGANNKIQIRNPFEEYLSKVTRQASKEKKSTMNKTGECIREPSWSRAICRIRQQLQDSWLCDSLTNLLSSLPRYVTFTRSSSSYVTFNLSTSRPHLPLFFTHTRKHIPFLFILANNNKQGLCELIHAK